MMLGETLATGEDTEVLDEATQTYFSWVEEGNVAEVTNCIYSQFMPVERTNLTGETGLIVASRLGFHDLVQFFCEAGADLSTSDDEYWTALLNAAHDGHFEVVKILVSHGADIETSDAFGWTPLFWAAYKNRIDILRFLIEQKADPDIGDDDGLTPLIVAAGRGYEEVCADLLKAGAGTSDQDKFGSTALLWATRRGYNSIVHNLLAAGADCDAIGMYGATPLIMATRGNYVDCVSLLLQYEPNCNLSDKEGQTALNISAREGYVEIVELLLESGAFVNVTDRRGDPVLISAVKSGNINIVSILLDKYAAINEKDSDGRTALHIAVEKGYSDVVDLLLKHRPSLELRTKEGDTPLLRAVRSRNLLIVQLLINAGCKVASADPAGDNPLHLSLRSRSKRMTQLLLARPKDARLLYRPNSNGDTPYSLDQSSPEPILPHIFGPMESQAQTEAMMGYDIYSNVLADILCEPNLTLPLTIGLYAKWGSGKSFLLNRMKEAMLLFSRSWSDSAELVFSWVPVFLMLFVGVLLSALVYFPSHPHFVSVLDWIPPLIVGIVFDFLFLLVYGIIYYGTNCAKNWPRVYDIGTALGKQLAKAKLILQIAFYHPPSLREKDLLACPVSVGGEQALSNIVLSLYDAAERHYGKLATRMYSAVKPNYTHRNRNKLRKQCGIPILLLVIGLILCFITSLFLFGFYFHCHESPAVADTRIEIGGNGTADSLIPTPDPTSTAAVEAEEYAGTEALVIGVVLLGGSLLLGIYPCILLLSHLLSCPYRRNLRAGMRKLDRLRFEGFMQLLQQHVDQLADMISCLDSFTRSRTRLVIFVDGLDNCEQDRMVQTLDALELLFCCRQNRPFIVIIAVDPHIIISAIDHSIHSALIGTELTGHHYLKNIVNLPFYLQNAALRRLQEKLRQRKEDLQTWKSRFLRQETIFGSYLSLREMEHGGSKIRRAASQLVGPIGTSTLSQTIMRDDYFSNINPRSMNRIINTLNLTGRLMRALEVEFSWVTLGKWISLVEQWPYRISWIIEYCEENPEIPPHTTLKLVYNQVKQRIPVLRQEDKLLDIDRNVENLELHLSAWKDERELTVENMRTFVPCTSNLDPYIRKLIRERRALDQTQNGTEGSHGAPLFTPLPVEHSFPPVSSGFLSGHPRPFVPVIHHHPDPFFPLAPTTSLALHEDQHSHIAYIFQDPNACASIPRLCTMTPQQVADVVKRMKMTEVNKKKYADTIVSGNISGIVLSLCDLDSLRSELKMNLGDWTMMKLFVDYLRNRKEVPVAYSDKALSTRNLWNPALPSPVHTATSEETKEQVSPLSSSTRKRAIGKGKSMEQKEAEDHNEWLEQRFGRLDGMEFAGDNVDDKESLISGRSRRSSVRFSVNRMNSIAGSDHQVKGTHYYGHTGVPALDPRF